MKCVFFFQETDYVANDQVDLYDDVIAAADGNNHEDQSYDEISPRTPGEPQKTENSARPTIVYTYGGKRQAVYVGNLTWVSECQFNVILMCVAIYLTDDSCILAG